LRLCFHGNGILSQFEGYEDLEEFDWKGYRERYGDIQRLDRILEAEGDSPNRYKASKQADVLMLFYLFSADELQHLFELMGYPWDPDFIPRNIEYYLARTSHGSTLSWVTHAWVMARSDRAGSWRLFRDALDSDVDDIQGGTTPEGIHMGAMAGTVDLMHRCYTGLESRGNVLHFNPCLPSDLERVRFQVRYRHQVLDVDVSRSLLTISSRPFAALPITVAYRGHFRDLSPGDRCCFRLLKPEERYRPDEPRDPSSGGPADASSTAGRDRI
ncbi:MAG TPA: glycosyl hydrolase family 65 protein, partial [Myxococcota bacterium]|nr:glycosyl hydrolase family 65 protein [Myxococcota bacterium]